MSRSTLIAAMTLISIVITTTARADEVTLRSTANMNIYPQVTCLDRARGIVNSLNMTIKPSEEISFGNTDCKFFTIRFGAPTYPESYELNAGGRYRFINNGGHWDLEPD